MTTLDSQTEILTELAGKTIPDFWLDSEFLHRKMLYSIII